MREKIFLETNVYEESMKRIARAYASFDKIYIKFSGGKDSLCVLKLVEEYFDLKGIKDKINVVFYDEEFIPSTIINFVQDYSKNPRYNFIYLCYQLRSEKYILGDKVEYIQWDNKRPHLRPIPKFAITSNLVFDQYSINKSIVGSFKGRVGFMTGVRSAESLTRLIACLGSKTPHQSNFEQNICTLKPIYDWEENDIFKYFYDKNIDYCKIYDEQVFNGEPLRVATPLHAEASKNIFKLKTRDPIFYNQICQIYPDVDIQARYYKEFRNNSVSIYENYEKSWQGIFDYINENIDDSMKKAALFRVQSCIKARNNQNNPLNPFGGYPILHVFNAIVKGNYKRNILPVAPSQLKKEHYDFEGMKYGSL